jgi:hypothetical protein
MWGSGVLVLLCAVLLRPTPPLLTTDIYIVYQTDILHIVEIKCLCTYRPLPLIHIFCRLLIFIYDSAEVLKHMPFVLFTKVILQYIKPHLQLI